MTVSVQRDKVFHLTKVLLCTMFCDYVDVLNDSLSQSTLTCFTMPYKHTYIHTQRLEHVFHSVRDCSASKRDKSLAVYPHLDSLQNNSHELRDCQSSGSEKADRQMSMSSLIIVSHQDMAAV